MPYKKKQTTTKKVPKAIAKYVKKAIMAPREHRFGSGWVTNVTGYHSTVTDVFSRGIYEFVFPSSDGGYNHRVGNVINANKLECRLNFCSIASPTTSPKVRLLVVRQPTPIGITSSNVLINLSGNKMLSHAGDPDVPQLSILYDKIIDLCGGQPSLLFNKIVKFNVNLRNKKIVYNDDKQGTFAGQPPSDDLRLYLIPWQDNYALGSPAQFSYDAELRLHYNEA